MRKNIRSKVVKESLLDYNTLANSLKENTESAVKNLLNEAVRDTYAKLLNEGDEDYEEEEVEDTNSDITTDDAEIDDDSTDTDSDVDSTDDGMDADTDSEETDDFGGDTETDDFGSDDTEDADGDEWAEFDKYKVSDDEYDFSNAEDEEIVKVYKLMKNDDQILVHKDDDKVKIQDNETGAEYIVDLGGDEPAGVGAVTPEAENTDFELEIGDDDDTDFDSEGDTDFEDDGTDFDSEGDTDFEDDGTDFDSEGDEVDDDFSDEDDLNNEDDDMNESTERMFELVLEYDSNVGYTDNYQKKDVMTNPGMSEPGKNVNDWDAGVPKGSSKPWSGKKGDKKENQPFDGQKGKTVEESAGEMGAKRGAHGRMTGTKSHNSSTGGYPYGQHHVSVAGEYKGDDQTGENVKESLARRVNKTINENKALKKTLNTVMSSLKEAAVTNCNLAQIVKLISENSTTQEEKKEIIGKFAKQAKTVAESKALYEAISEDLKKVKKMNITEGKSLTVEGSKKINETTIYKSPDVMESLDLMHRMMK